MTNKIYELYFKNKLVKTFESEEQATQYCLVQGWMIRCLLWYWVTEEIEIKEVLQDKVKGGFKTMYKITYLPTGHIFELPYDAAKELKEKYPNDYKILEKNKNIKITKSNKPTRVKVTTSDNPTRVTISAAHLTNEKCPSCDCGICKTFPAPYEVQCGGEETKNCLWLNFDFGLYKYCQRPETNTEKEIQNADN